LIKLKKNSPLKGAKNLGRYLYPFLQYLWAC